MNGVCATNGVRRRLGEADVTHLSFGNEPAHFTDRVLDRNRLVDSMGEIEVDLFDAETLQRGFAGRAHIVRTAVDASAAIRQEFLAEFRGYDDLVADRGERFANELLVAKRTIGIGRIEEIDAEFDDVAQQRNGGLVVGSAISARQSHAAITHGRDRKLSNLTLLHIAFLISSTLISM